MLNSEAMMRYLYKEMSPEESNEFISEVNSQLKESCIMARQVQRDFPKHKLQFLSNLPS